MVEGDGRDGRKRSYSGKVKRFLGAPFRRGVRECLTVQRGFNTFVILRGYVRRLKQKKCRGKAHGEMATGDDGPPVGGYPAEWSAGQRQKESYVKATILREQKRTGEFRLI